MSFKKIGDCEFVTTIVSEKFGTLLLEEKYTEEVAHHVRLAVVPSVAWDF